MENQFNHIPSWYPDPLPPAQRPSWGQESRSASRLGLALFLYIIVVSALQMVLMLLAEYTFPGFERTELYSWLLMCLPSYAVGFPFFCLMLIGLPKERPASRPLGVQNWVGFLAVSFMLMTAGEIIAAVLMKLMESLRGEEITNIVSEQIGSSSPLMNLIVVAILAPVVEELMFRKLLMDRLLPYSEGFAVLTGGLAFGLMHGNFYQFFYATFLGLLFSVIYVKTGRIRYTIGMHMIINFIGAFISDMLNDLLVGTQNYAPWYLIAALFELATLTLGICGLVMLILGRRRLKFSAANRQGLSFAQQLKFGWRNTGIICFFVICALSFIISIFM